MFGRIFVQNLLTEGEIEEIPELGENGCERIIAALPTPAFAVVKVIEETLGRDLGNGDSLG